METSPPVRSDYAWPNHSAGFPSGPLRWASEGRPDEHHAGLGNSADPRDWGRKGSGRAPEAHPPQFLAESLTITFIGGALGIILAYGVSLSVGRLTLYSAVAKNAQGGDVSLIIAPSTLIVATLIPQRVGLVSGMVPAIRASRLGSH